MRPKVPERALWVTQRKGPLRYEALIAMLNKLGRCAGVEDTMTHRFRHTFSAEHYKANRDIKALQSALGHSSVVTTEGYLLSLGVDFAMQARPQTRTSGWPDAWFVNHMASTDIMVWFIIEP